MQNLWSVTATKFYEESMLCIHQITSALLEQQQKKKKNEQKEISRSSSHNVRVGILFDTENREINTINCIRKQPRGLSRE